MYPSTLPQKLEEQKKKKIMQDQDQYQLHQVHKRQYQLLEHQELGGLEI